MSRITGKSLGTLAAALTLTTALVAPNAANAQEGPNTGNVTLTLGADVVSQYYFRGYLQEDSGVIFQPYVDVAFNVFNGEDAINSIDIYGGAWSSLHSSKTLPSSLGGTTSNIYETDYYFGVAATLFDVFTADLAYIAYTYPGSGAGTVQEIALTIGFDDSEYFGNFSLNPYVMFAFEIDGGSDAYFEAGIEPSFLIYESEDYPVTFSLPITLGLSLDDYYMDSTGSSKTFGYASVGFMFSTPLSFVPAEFGTWEATAGLQVLFLNDDVVGFDDNNEDIQPVAIFGVSMTY